MSENVYRLVRQLQFLQDQWIATAAGTVQAATSSTALSRRPQVYVFYGEDDSEAALNFVQRLSSEGFDALLPALDGSVTERRSYNDMLLKACDCVAILWERSSELWVKTRLLELRDAVSLGRTGPFLWRAVVLLAPKHQSKSIFLRVPGPDADIVIDAMERFDSATLKPLVDKTPGLLPRERLA